MYRLIYDGRRAFEAPIEFYNEVLELGLWIVPALLPGARYTARMLLGPEFWACLDAPGKHLAGRCIADMVRHERLPLQRIGCRHRRPVQYELDA